MSHEVAGESQGGGGGERVGGGKEGAGVGPAAQWARVEKPDGNVRLGWHLPGSLEKGRSTWVHASKGQAGAASFGGSNAGLGCRRRRAVAWSLESESRPEVTA